MPELSLQERLQPSLLDRLTDDEPEKTQESRTKRVISLRELRAIILRDLSWLLNCTNLASSEDLADYPEVERSVLNFGLRDLSSQTTDSVKTASRGLERMLDRAIRTFEPRILAKTLKVKILPPKTGREVGSVTFEIEGMLWAQPLPLSLYLETELDLEIGQANVRERGHSGFR